MGIAMQSTNVSNDEIDLVALFQALWQQRLVILAVTFTCALVSVGYALLAVPYYKTTTFLRPTDRSSLDQLNETGIYSLSPEEALGRIAAGLSSYGLRRQYFEQHPEFLEALKREGRSDTASFNRFNEGAFAILRPDPKRTEDRNAYVGLALTYPESVDGVSIVNGFVEFVLKNEREAILREIEHLTANRLAGLQAKIQAGRAAYESSKATEIAALLEEDAIARAKLVAERDALRAQLKTMRENRIKQLEEAIGIADSLGIRKPTPLLGIASASLDRNAALNAAGNLEVPLYFLGTDALTAERDALLERVNDDFAEPRIAEIEKQLLMLQHNPQVQLMRQRDTDDPFLADMAKWREEAARLKAIDLNVASLRLVRVDQPAMEPLSPVKPRRPLIVALGTVLGLMLGIFVALLRLLSSSRS
ncbi:Wzz/FepE/Etk N-terminal domain-containing protein [Stutzerimonas balearica]|uniref:Wzz/FepE/Etk N-terminal domain-containing protein n=1 Tax=Stutzerimonas balearica TaxID=74829 RepID=UPI002896BFBF|nr:Wzz/FepE/Etk N-terminal domain-containing protein [Stutzerimonas balearica]